MGSLSLHPLVPVGLLVGILMGCASASRTSGGEVAALPQGDTAAVSPSDSAAAPQDSPTDPNTVTSEDIRNARGQPIEMILEGRVAGVSVFRTSNGIAVRIHGDTTSSPSRCSRIPRTRPCTVCGAPTGSS
jgi:hypothetical protein